MTEKEKKTTEYFNYVDFDDIPLLLPFLQEYAKKREMLMAMQKATGINSVEECQAYHHVKSCEECPLFRDENDEEKKAFEEHFTRVGNIFVKNKKP